MVVDTGLPMPDMATSRPENLRHVSYNELVRLHAEQAALITTHSIALGQSHKRIKDLEAIEHKLNGECERLSRLCHSYEDKQVAQVFKRLEAAPIPVAQQPVMPPEVPEPVHDSRLITELRAQINALEREVASRADNQAMLRARINSLLFELEGPQRGRS